MRLETQENLNFEAFFSHDMDENWGRTDEEHFEKSCLNLRKEYFCCLDLQDYWRSNKKDFIKNKGIEQYKQDNRKITLIYYSEATDYGHKPLLKALKNFVVEQLSIFLCFKIMRTDTMVEKALRSIIKKGQRIIIDKVSKLNEKEPYNEGKGVHICLNILILQNNKAYAANIGGNRLFFIQRTQFRKFFEAKYLTAYHTSENVIEMYRVKREQYGKFDEFLSSATSQLKDSEEDDTPLTLPEMNITRAIGAFKIKGISSEPDIKIIDLKFKHLAIFFGSLGLWKVLKTQKIVNEVQECLIRENLKKAFLNLKSAYRKEMKKELASMDESERVKFMQQAEYCGYMIYL